MSAVGEYVHLTAAGYNAYGIYRRDSRGRKENIDSMNSRTMDQLLSEVTGKSSLSKANVKKIESILQCIFNPKTESEKAKAEQIRARVLNHIEEAFGIKLQAENINWETGDIEIQNDSDFALNLLHRTLERSDSKQGKRLDPAKVRKEIETMNLIISKGIHNFQDKNLTINELVTKVEKIEEQANELWGDLSQYSNSVFNDLGLPSLAEKGRFAQEQSFAKQVNELIERIGTAPIVNLQKGGLFNFLISYLPYMAGELSIDEVTQQIKTINVGGKARNITYSSKKVGPQQKWMLNIQKDNGFQTYHCNVSKQSPQKIDIKLEWNNSPLKISSKYVSANDFSRINVSSGNNLMFMIQDISTDFVNHYLNLNAMHIDSSDKEGAQQYLTRLKKQKNTIASATRNRVNQTMKKLLAIKAITGKVFGREQANVMVINDNQTGKIRVITMQDIAKKIKDMSSTQLSLLSINLDDTNIMNFKGFDNEPGQDEYGIERIYTNLYKQLHEIKVSASIQQNAFYNFG